MACTSCQVIVRDGLDRLTARSEDEIDILDRVATPEGARLACQAVSTGGDFTIELPVDEIPALSRSRSPVAPLTLSKRAADHFAAQLAKNRHCDAVRLSVKPVGCSGLGYSAELIQGRQAGDALFESAGVAIVVDSASLPHLQGTRVDLVSEGLGTHLRFDNPNALDICGCGNSFRS